ncbi:RICIN domain-containing protein [Paenibacillus oryzisoli]|uniref:Ricin B lectin domain-containing protein n=1 Tax=Paenibacillus oryzisoli TaxID=1850517 RepID=A0A198A1D6_9BACL|nr:RICIN domain-containing protein [Paenibacillus oryzisoli]OAS14912.1 hypothetical protein A8708_05280 [Paenibacillus oryzisoli]
MKKKIQSFVSKRMVAFLVAALIAMTSFIYAQPASAASTPIVNAVNKNATNGDPIWAQGGWMMKESDTYYWYGLDASEPMKLADGITLNPNWKKKVSAYSSTDLVNWTAHREIVDFPSIDAKLGAGTFNLNQWFGRPLVQYNSELGKYVMYLEWGCCNFRVSVSIWYSDSPVGPFEFQKVIENPGGLFGNGDLGSIFTDTDGTTYITQTVDRRLTTKLRADGTYQPDYNSGIYIGRVDTALNASNEYEITITPVKLFESVAPNKEATTLFKVGSTYYMLASETNGWKSSPTYYYTASSVTGVWSSATKIGTTSWNGSTYSGSSPTGGNSFDTQFDQVFAIQGTAGTTYLFIGDRWNNMKNSDGTPGSYGPGRNQWYPLTFDSAGKPILNGYQQWYIDLAAGTWTATAPASAVDTQLTYAIVNGNSSKALGITNNVITDGATLEQRPYTGAASQSWEFVEAGSGYYNIRNKNSGKYMDIQSASTANGGQSIQWTTSGATSQQWQLVDAGGGKFIIKNRNSGKALGMSGGSTGDGAPVIQWAESGSANQTWRLDAVAPIDLTKTYSIINRNSMKSLGTVGNAIAAGTNVEQRPYTGAISQSWQFEYTNGYYKIKNVNSGSYMDIAGSSTANGASNVINPGNSSTSQLWQLVDVDGVYYKLKNVNSGRMLGLSAGSTADGAINMQWTESSSLNQNWSFTILNP